jgi:hypothetical protein
MKTPNEQDELLADVLADQEQLRASTLQAGLTALRHARRRRAVIRISSVVVLPLAVLGLFLFRSLPPSSGHEAQDLATARREISVMVEGTHIRVVNDAELLAFFEGRPVALVGPSHHQQLVLLDETGQ